MICCLILVYLEFLSVSCDDSYYIGNSKQMFSANIRYWHENILKCGRVSLHIPGVVALIFATTVFHKSFFLFSSFVLSLLRCNCIVASSHLHFAQLLRHDGLILSSLHHHHWNGDALSVGLNRSYKNIMIMIWFPDSWPNGCDNSDSITKGYNKHFDWSTIPSWKVCILY